MALNREQIREQAAGQHNDQAGMREVNSELAPVPAETLSVSRDQVHQQHCANQMAARKNRQPEATGVSGPPDKHALEIALLGFVNTKVNLGDRTSKNQYHRRSQTNNCQLERRKQINNSTPHVAKTETGSIAGTQRTWIFDLPKPNRARSF